MPTENEIINGIRRPGSYHATVASEADAKRLVRAVLPHAVEVPAAVVGQPYPLANQGIKAWYQVHPAEPNVGHNLPHVKYENWTKGKKKSGGSWGHLFFP